MLQCKRKFACRPKLHMRTHKGKWKQRVVSFPGLLFLKKGKFKFITCFVIFFLFIFVSNFFISGFCWIWLRTLKKELLFFKCIVAALENWVQFFLTWYLVSKFVWYLRVWYAKRVKSFNSLRQQQHYKQYFNLKQIFEIKTQKL